MKTQFPSFLVQNLAQIRKIFDRMCDQAGSTHVILVEGVEDVRALQSLCIAKGVVPISKKSLAEFVEGLPSGKGFITLTDFDRKGSTMAKLLRELLPFVPATARARHWKPLSGFAGATRMGFLGSPHTLPLGDFRKQPRGR